MKSTIFAGLLGAAIGCGPREGDTTTLREAQVQDTPTYQAAQADPMVHPDDPDNRTLPREGYLDDYRQPLTTPQGRLDDDEDDDVDDNDRYYVPQSTQPNTDVDRDDDEDDDDVDVDTPDVDIHGEATAPDLDVPDVDVPDVDVDVDAQRESSTSDQVPAVPPEVEVPVHHDTPDPW